MVTIVTTNGSYISPANEAVYHQSRLIGTWSGTMNGQSVAFTVKNVKGNQAQVEYKHGSKTDRGTATVSENMVTFNNVTVATKNGSLGALVFEAGTLQKSYKVTKTAAPTQTTTTASSYKGSGGISTSASATSGATAVNLLA